MASYQGEVALSSRASVVLQTERSVVVVQRGDVEASGHALSGAAQVKVTASAYGSPSADGEGPQSKRQIDLEI